jgi:hypothetical protein
VIDYLGAILAREEMRRHIGEGGMKPTIPAFVAEANRPRRRRSRLATALRWTADRLEATGRGHPARS